MSIENNDWLAGQYANIGTSIPRGSHGHASPVSTVGSRDNRIYTPMRDSLETLYTAVNQGVFR